MSIAVDNVAEAFDLPTTVKSVSRERIVNEFAKTTQYITWPLLFVIFRGVFDIDIQGNEIFKKVKDPFIIVANHISFYDSFLFRLILGLRTDHLPLRFMAVTKFEKRYLTFLAKIGIVDFVYSLFGVFTVTPGLGIDKNIQKAKEIIKIGGNIVIYPEGRISGSAEIGQFKKGAAFLQKETGVCVIPVSFRHGKRKWLRRKLQINVGEVISISGMRSVEEITEIFQKVVTRLHSKISE